MMVFSLVLHVDTTGHFKNSFWQNIGIPNEISIHLIGRAKQFYQIIKYSIFVAPFQFCNGGLKNETCISM